MKIKLKAIRFRSDQKLKNSIGLIKVKQLKKNFHSAKLSEVEIDMLLKGYFSTHQMMQRSDFQALCGMLRSTAMIHIRRICREGKLQNIGLRNQPIYVPVPGFYGTSRDQPTLRWFFGWRGWRPEGVFFEGCFQPLLPVGRRLWSVAEEAESSEYKKCTLWIFMLVSVKCYK